MEPTLVSIIASIVCTATTVIVGLIARHISEISSLLQKQFNEEVHSMNERYQASITELSNRIDGIKQDWKDKYQELYDIVKTNNEVIVSLEKKIVRIETILNMKSRRTEKDRVENGNNDTV